MIEYGYERSVVGDVLRGIGLKKPLLQIMTGPRQVGKTIAALQIAGRWAGPVVNASADMPLPPGPEWIQAQWERAVNACKQHNNRKEPVLLILDEVQKVKGWSEVVKALWDHACQERAPIQVLVLGSSSLLLQKGLSDSLAGRFLLHRCGHWGLWEMEQAFSWDLDRWIYFGGYPGTAELAAQEDLWARYVVDSLIETVLSKDVLQLETVAKPALLRHLFMLSAIHPAQILSYNKMLGQLQDAGNTTTLAHYLKLFEAAFLVSGLECYKGRERQKRGSSPKLIVWNNGLINALSGRSFESARNDFSWWGRLVENAVGSHLLNHLRDLTYTVHYWRQRGCERDFVVRTPEHIWGIEVKSGVHGDPRGMSAFCKAFPDARTMIVGHQGMPLEDFFRTHPKDLF